MPQDPEVLGHGGGKMWSQNVRLKRLVFDCFLNLRVSVGRLFHDLAAETEKARAVRVSGTNRVGALAEQRNLVAVHSLAFFQAISCASVFTS